MSDFLAGVGVLVAAAASAGSILLPPGRLRSLAMLAAIALFPALILGDQWHSHQIADLRHHTDRIVALALVGFAAIVALTAVFRRWPMALPLAIVAALPFRVPLHAGGDTANLLVPLYLVIAAGVLAAVLRDWKATPRQALRANPVQWLTRVLAAVVVLYALQTLYSPDFSKGLQSVCFFLVPFTVSFALLRDCEWDGKLLVAVLWVVTVEAVLFVIVGSIEFASRSLFWNQQVIRSNDFHTYFRVNSVFWDPNIYGRYLSLVIVVATTALLWAKERRNVILLAALIAVLWIGLVPTYSQSSFVALLAGLAVLAALRWSWRWTLGAVGIAAVLGVAVVLFAGGASKLSPSRLNIDTSGRANLVSGGIHLFAQRPVWGYGSGSFQKAYVVHVHRKRNPVSVSHTEPVTVAAEQGAIGLALYAALLVTALWTMTTGLGSLMPGLAGSRAGGAGEGGSPPHGGCGGQGFGPLPASSRRPEQRAVQGEPPSPAQGPAGLAVGRAAVLASFVALLIHTMAYAGFYEDPITWVLLAVGASLAAAPVRTST